MEATKICSSLDYKNRPSYWQIFVLLNEFYQPADSTYVRDDRQLVCDLLRYAVKAPIRKLELATADRATS